MLYLIGLGLHDEGDLTLKGLRLLKQADRAYVEKYTNFYHGSLEKIESWAEKKINVLEREGLEENIDSLLKQAQEKKIAVLVPGDPLVATTHADILFQARSRGIEVKIIHSSSVYCAVAETGLHIYKFGKTTTLPYPQKGYLPTSPYKSILENKKRGLHSLILLDVKYQENKYMRVSEAIEVLWKMEEKEEKGLVNENMLLVGLSRLGGNGVIKSGTPSDLMGIEFGDPPHSLIIPGEMHFTEKQVLELY